MHTVMGLFSGCRIESSCRQKGKTFGLFLLHTFEIRGDEKVDEAGEEGWEEDHYAEAQP